MNIRIALDLFEISINLHEYSTTLSLPIKMTISYIIDGERESWPAY